MFDFIISFVSGHWVAIFLILFTASAARNFFKRGLNKYSGPLIASITDWWRFFDVLGRRPDITHIKLHKQYGDIVRLGPNVLSFSNPAAMKVIYGLHKGFTKVFHQTLLLIKPIL